MPSSINVSDSEIVCNKNRPEVCPFCGNTRFWKHGHYCRTGFYRPDRQNPPPGEDIQRYLCKTVGCKRTFSDLPEDVLPYCRFYLDDYLLLYGKSLTGTSAFFLWKACHLVDISLKAIQRLLLLFKKALYLVQKIFLEEDGPTTESLASKINFLAGRHTWFGFTSRWYHALYPARLWENPNPHNLRP